MAQMLEELPVPMMVGENSRENDLPPSYMQVGILRAGAMAQALGGRWVAAGHEVVIGARSRAKAISLAEAIGARAGTAGDAASPDVVLLAVHHAGVEDALRRAGAASGALTAKVLIDCTNPVELQRFTIELPDGVASIAEHVAAISGARVEKAFNMCDATVWAAPAELDSSRLSVMFAADDNGAGELVARLINGLGHRAVPVGGLDRARYLESAAALVISLLSRGEPRGSILNWTHVSALVARGSGQGASS